MQHKKTTYIENNINIHIISITKQNKTKLNYTKHNNKLNKSKQIQHYN